MFSQYSKFKEAEPFAREALRLSEEVHGGDDGSQAHTSIVTSLCLLAGIISAPDLGRLGRW